MIKSSLILDAYKSGYRKGKIINSNNICEELARKNSLEEIGLNVWRSTKTGCEYQYTRLGFVPYPCFQTKTKFSFDSRSYWIGVLTGIGSTILAACFLFYK